MKDQNLVIMIDDDTDDHEFFKIALSEVNPSLKCMVFENCKQALEHFSHKNVKAPRLVFIDINLPAVSGPDCLLELQNFPLFDDPCIVILSGSIPEKWRKSLKAIGVNEFVEKTSSISLLVEKLQALLT